jgi:hypothetical protein
MGRPQPDLNLVSTRMRMVLNFGPMCTRCLQQSARLHSRIGAGRNVPNGLVNVARYSSVHKRRDGRRLNTYLAATNALPSRLAHRDRHDHSASAFNYHSQSRTFTCVSQACFSLHVYTATECPATVWQRRGELLTRHRSAGEKPYELVCGDFVHNDTLAPSRRAITRSRQKIPPSWRCGPVPGRCGVEASASRCCGASRSS